MTLSIVGLGPEHDAVDIARAFLVALAFGVRELIDLVEPFAGPIAILTTSGEAGASGEPKPRWCSKNRIAA